MQVRTKAGALGRRRFRSWLAVWLQRRRRSRAGAVLVVPTPVITGYALADSEGEPLYWFDVLLEFTFDQGQFPDGSIEVYWARQSGGWVEGYVGLVASTERTFRHSRAFSDVEGDDLVGYRIRYLSGDETIIGPLSEQYQVNYVAP